MESKISPDHHEDETMGEAFAKALGQIESGETEQQKEGHKEPIQEVAESNREHP